MKKVDTERKVNDVQITHRKAAQVFRGSDTAALQRRLWFRPYSKDFTNLVSAVRQMLMYYVNIFSFLENIERTWGRINAELCKDDTGKLELGY